MNIHDLANVTIAENPYNVWASGDTWPARAELAAAGFRWSGKRQAWWLRRKEYDKLMKAERELKREYAARDKARREFERGNKRWERERRTEFTRIILDNGGIKMSKSLHGEYNTDVPLHLKRKDGLYLDEFVNVVNEAGQFGRIETDDDLINLMGRLW